MTISGLGAFCAKRVTQVHEIGTNRRPEIALSFSGFAVRETLVMQCWSEIVESLLFISFYYPRESILGLCTKRLVSFSFQSTFEFGVLNDEFAGRETYAGVLTCKNKTRGIHRNCTPRAKRLHELFEVLRIYWLNSRCFEIQPSRGQRRGIERTRPP